MSARSGRLQIRNGACGRVWVAVWRDGAGRHKKTLGRVWVKRHRKTAKGAPKWRAADGPKPEGFLSPRDAEQALRDLLVDAPAEPVVARVEHTFGEACEEWLRYVERDRDHRPSTVRDYRNTVKRYPLPHYGADAPIERITTEDVDAYREALLDEGRLSRRTIQKILVLLHGILKRAKRKKWIASNPAENAERITLKRSGDFNALSPSEVEAVVRAAADEQDAAIFLRRRTPASAFRHWTARCT